MLLPVIGRAQTVARARDASVRVPDAAASIVVAADLTWSPRTLESITLICSADTTINVYLQNTTPFPLDIPSVIMLAGNNFAVQAGVPIRIPGGGQAPIGLKFTPPAQGTYRDTIQIYMPDRSPDIVKIPVQGRRETVAFATFTLAGDTIDLGNICPNTPKDFGFALTSLSTIPTSFTGEIESPFMFLGDSLGLTYSVNGAHTIRIRFIGSPTDSVITAGLRIYDRCGRMKPYVLRASVGRPHVDVGPDVTICKGESLNLAGDVTGGAPPFTYQWTPEESLNFPATARTTATPDSTTRYILTVTDANGCKGRDTMLVTVSFSKKTRVITSTTRPVCPGDTVVLTAEPYPFYLWSNGDTTRAIKVTRPGNYAVTVTDARGCSGTSDSVRVRFHARPSSDIVGARSVCPGHPETYSVAGGRGHSYSWSVIGGGSISSGDGTETITVDWASIGDWTLRLIHTIDSSGCTIDTAITVSVNPSLKPPINASGGNVICEGDSLTLSTDPYVQYTWSTGEKGRSIVVREPGRYTVAVTGIGGCTGVSDTFEVIRRDPPRPVIRGAAIVCTNASLTYLVENGAGSTFDWSLDGGGAIFNGQGGAFVGVRWDKPGTWTLHVRQTLDSSSCAAETTLVVKVADRLFPAITALGPTTFCAGDSVLLDGGEGYLGYKWSNGDTGRIITARVTGDYAVTASAAGCSAVSAPVHVIAHPAPVPSIAVAGATLTSTPEAAYQWYQDSVAIPGATSMSLTVGASGSYGVAVVDSLGCAGRSAPVVVDLSPLTLALPADSARPGESIIIPLMLTGSSLSGGPHGYAAEIRFNRTLLKPLDVPGASWTSAIVGDSCILTIQGDRSDASGDTLARLSFLALLGDAASTTLRIADFRWLDGAPAPRVIDGAVALAGLCRTGPPRLVGPAGSFGLKSIVPNPSNGRASIVIDLDETGPATLILADMLGRPVATLLDGRLAPGRYAVELDAEGLSTGVYYCILRSPTRVDTREMRMGW
jgi:hypothetical protein